MQVADQDEPEFKHHVYVLRCWRELDGSWRYTLEAVDGRPLARRGFTRRAALLAYLRTQLPDDALPGPRE